MKKLLLLLTILLLSPLTILAQQNLFTLSGLEKPLSKQPHFSLHVNTSLIEKITENRPCAFDVNMPFFNNETLELNLEYFEVFTSDFQLTKTTKSGLVYDDYSPKIISYRIHGPDLSGSISILDKKLIGFIKNNGKMYEIIHLERDQYLLIDISKSSLDFICETEDLPLKKIQTSEQSLVPTNQGNNCINLAIDIDYYTYLQFGNNCYDAAEWALAILAGVSEIYMSELDVPVQANHIHICNVPDIYQSIDNPLTMVNALQSNWESNFPNVERHAAHLFTKKLPSTNEPAGYSYYEVINDSTIEFGQLCSDRAYASNMGLNDLVDYNAIDPVNFLFSGNFFMVAHELGHNIGSLHTHACLWLPDETLLFPGGAIDGCVNFDEADSVSIVSASTWMLDSCDEGVGIPPSEVWQQPYGTIMSYCAFNDSVDVYYEFHPIVKSQALLPAISNFNQLACSFNCNLNTVYECSGDWYGCTDPEACNYDPNAIEEPYSEICQFPGDEVQDCWELSGNEYDCACCWEYLVILDSTGNIEHEWVYLCGCNDPNACNYDPNADLGNSIDCEYNDDCLEVNLIEKSLKKDLITTLDILGRETTNNKGFQLHIYDDGSVEKKYLIK